MESTEKRKGTRENMRMYPIATETIIILALKLSCFKTVISVELSPT